MKHVRLGVIGAGVIGRKHLEVAMQSPLINVIALADIREQVARELAEKFSISTVYNDADALLNNPQVEAVVLAMPACYRTNLALRAFTKGKHVLIEKPVAMNANEVKQLIKAHGNLTVGCCSARYRLLESANFVTEFILSGVLGKLRVVHCRAIGPVGEPPKVQPPAWRLKKSLNGGGIMVNWGCYDLDYLLGITGWKLIPRKVFAHIWKVSPQLESYVAPGSDAETHVIGIIRCEDDTVISIERGEMVSSRVENSCQIIGTKGSLQLNMLPDQGKKIIHYDSGSGKGMVSKIIWEGNEDPEIVHSCVVDFADAIRKHREPKTNLEQALVIQKITDAIYASSEQGVAIEIN